MRSEADWRPRRSLKKNTTHHVHHPDPAQHHLVRGLTLVRHQIVRVYKLTLDREAGLGDIRRSDDAEVNR
jgi:hypothetical protein